MDVMSGPCSLTVGAGLRTGAGEVDGKCLCCCGVGVCVVFNVCSFLLGGGRGAGAWFPGEDVEMDGKCCDVDVAFVVFDPCFPSLGAGPGTGDGERDSKCVCCGVVKCLVFAWCFPPLGAV